MVKEAVLKYETAPPLPFTCTNATGIERGTAVTLSDLMTVAACSDSTTSQGGITAEEKIALDGKTKVPVYREGVFKVFASGAVTVGEAVVFQDNYASRAPVDGEHVAGMALETAADTESFLFELRPLNTNQA